MAKLFKDCCLTCWFNRRNRSRAGYPTQELPEEPDFCELRELPVRDPKTTYCANHPIRFPDKLDHPVGPVYRSDSWGVRRVWRASPDTEAIRQQLLKLLDEMPAQPRPEYPFGVPFDEIVIWQLGQFKETRAREGLRRVIEFDSDVSDEVFGLNRFMAVRSARDALAQVDDAPGRQQLLLPDELD